MFPYWLLFSLFAVGALQNNPRRVMQSRVLLIVGSVLVALMIGLRYEVGGDWGAYIRHFNAVRHLELGDALLMGDPGYTLLNWAAHKLGAGIWAVNITCGLIFAWGVYRLAAIQPNPWLALAVAVPYLIIVVAMGYSRQGVAIGLLMVGFAGLGRHSLPRFVLYTLLAASFHKTALIVLPLVAVSVTRNKLVVIASVGASAVLSYFVFLQSAVDELTALYVDAKVTSEGALIRIIMNLIPASIFLLYQNKFAMPNEQRMFWRNLSFAAFAALILLIGIEASTVVDRLSLYMIPLQLVVLSRLPIALQGKHASTRVLTIAVLAYSALIQFTWLNFAAHAHYWLPYNIYPFFASS